ncbi:MAG: AMP-binding protein [Magnetococcales bacterium]|nr:AMP-binding protein [Magnetococcales bacterium]
MWRDFIRQQAQNNGQKLAIIDRLTNRCLTYDGLDHEINRWVRHLLQCGIKPANRVVYLAPNRLEHLTLFFACTRLGAIFVPLNHRLAPRELEQLVEHIEPGYFLGEAPCPFAATSGYDQIKEIDLTDGPTVDPLPLTGKEPLLMLFTSGSTGEPKGVLLHGDMLMANIQQTLNSGVLLANDISVVNTPFFHTGGYNVFCLPLLFIGGTLILFDKFDPDGVLEAIDDEGVTVFWAVPTMFQALYESARFDKTDFSRIRFFLSGGAPLSLPLIQAYHKKGIPFKQGFGLTEVGPNCFLHETEESYQHPDSIGRPMAQTLTKVVDDQGNPVAVGEIGELLLGGPHLCLGYWRKETIFQHAMRGIYFATGDLVRLDESGLFYVVGRKNEMYISGGENIFPGEVERQLIQHPGISQAVVVSVADEKWSEVGFAFYVGTHPLRLAEVRAFLEPLLARYKHPHHLFRLTQLPLLANGKIDRRQLKKMAKQALM